MRSVLVRFALLALATLRLHAAEPAPTLTEKKLYALWTGEWTGVLEYRDYQPPHGRVTLPTLLEVTPTPDAAALILRFVYDDGPKKTVKSTSRLAFDPDARRLIWTDESKPARPEDTFTLAEASPDGTRLVFLGTQMDDNKTSRVRYTFATAASSWRILKETTSDGPDFAFRHEYRFRR
ncbi:MAG: hypothetical protein H7343_06115 [Undibacterium sp.]|nr:hypothetical protein [Opitutaceae bacterium]